MTALATTPAATAFQIVPVNLIAPSPTNPRHRHSNQASNLKAWNLTELAESIRQHDVMQPITLRPNPLHTEGDGQPPFELVAGERRWRASQLAGKADVPAMVREISDAMVLVLQITENIQGEPLHPLEEAEHFERMLAAEGGPKDAEELAAIVGKSKTLVRNRLELLKLCTRVREACLANAISASVALEIANGAPHEADQLKALGEAAAGWGGDPFTARSMRAHMKKHYMLRLDQARFDIAAQYVMSRYEQGKREVYFDCGPCAGCPKRTGANPDFFDDVKEGDLCQDAKCFNAKAEAARSMLLDAAREEGATVISGDQAKKLMGSGSKPHGHQLLDQPCIAFSDHPKALRAAVGNAITSADMVFIDLPGSDAPVIVVSDAVAQRALKSKGLLKITAPMPPAKKKPKTSDMALYSEAETTAAKMSAARDLDKANSPSPEDADAADKALLDELLQFDVIPDRKSLPSSKLSQHDIDFYTRTAIDRAKATMYAFDLAHHLATDSAEGLPAGGFARLVLVVLLDLDADIGLDVAARLVGAEPPPAPNMGQKISEWMWGLPEEQACRMVMILMATQSEQGCGESSVYSRFPTEVARLVEFDPPGYKHAAEDLVNERLKIELLKRAPPAAAPKKPAAKKASTKKSAPAKSTGETKPIAVKNGSTLSPVAAWPFPTDKV
jgi:ParB/RepB/Spo0J family partition protein